VIAKPQWAEAVWPVGPTVNIGRILGIKGLHKHLKSIRSKDVRHEAKDAQALLES
jgi:hypothetical protein